MWVTRLEPHGFEGTDLTLDTPAGGIAFRLPLPGLYNVYNALAAATGALALGVSLAAVREGLAGFSAAFGRLERATVAAGTPSTLVLAKNPVGMNEALRTLFAGRRLPAPPAGPQRPRRRRAGRLLDLGRRLRARSAGHARSVTVSGRRAEDLALRLKYAGVPGPQVARPIRARRAGSPGR